jgi:hypothetical protein
MGMTIVARRRRVIVGPRRRRAEIDRVGPAHAGRDARSDLARIALDIVVRSLDPASIPPRWSTHAFGREVALVRRQLAPIRSREALAESFRREAAVAVTATAGPSTGEPPGPVRVAYAIRWLQLGDDRNRPSWEDWTARPPGSPSAGSQRNGEITA